MYGKLFTSIYDGSLRGHWEAMVTLQQLVILANRHGEVDMTPGAIIARTGIPDEVIRKGLAELEEPDQESRGPEEGGRRIVRLDDRRTWGWRIVNYLHYRNLASEQDKREQSRERQRRHREDNATSQPVTQCHAPSRMSRHAEADVEAKAEAEAVPELKLGSEKNPRRAQSQNVLLAASGDQPPPGAAEGLPGLLTTTGQFAFLTAPYAAELARLSPGVNLPDQVLAMARWCLAAGPQSKTPRGIPKFVSGWLNREQNKRHGPPPSDRPHRGSRADAEYAEQFKTGGAR